MNEEQVINILNNNYKTDKELEYLKNNYAEILRILFKNANEETFSRIKKIINNNNFFKHYAEDLYFFQPLNVRSKDNWQEKKILDSSFRKEPLVALNKYDYNKKKVIQLHPRIFVSPIYYDAHRQGTLPEIYVREQVLESILTHLELLPKDYAIMVYDGFRTYACQKDIYDEIFHKKFLEEKDKDNKKSEQEINNYLKDVIMPNYVSYPSYNPPSTHNTGGAIDMRLCDSLGNVLNYGCEFDEFESIANRDYFENKLQLEHTLSDKELECLITRRITTNLFKYPTQNLVNNNELVKKNNSFVEFYGEDWHYDLNNQWDMDLKEAIYGSCEKDNIKPNPNYTIIEYIKKYH